MLLNRIVVPAIAVCLASLCASSAQSQQPAQQGEVKQPETTATQPKDAEDQRGTDQSPLIVQIAPTPKTDDERADEAKERVEKAEVERRKEKSDADLVKYTAELASFTKWLFIATTGLVAATIGLLGFAYKQSLDTRRMIDITRDEFLATHRPKIRIKHFRLANDVWSETPIIINLTCVNTGTADAILHQMGFKFFVVLDGDALPVERIAHILRFDKACRVTTGFNYDFPPIKQGFALTVGQNTEIQQGRSKLYGVGYVSYFDGAGLMRITGFCRVLTFPLTSIAHTGNCRFRTFHDPEYEYED